MSSSSSNINNFAASPEARRSGFRASDRRSPNNSDYHEVPVFYRSRSVQATPDERASSALNRWRFLEDTGLYSIPSFAAQRHSIFLPRSSTSQTNEQVHTRVDENSRSRAMSKLKKEVYNPTPKLLARKVSLYYRDVNGGNALESKDREKKKEKEEEEGKSSCAVCLEDFEAKQEVMVTPCKHLFHEDCIVPWLANQGQCPICRLVICERPSSSFNNNNDNVNVAPSDLIVGELLSILSAVEEAFHLRNETR